MPTKEKTDEYSPASQELLHLAALLSLDFAGYDTRRFICGLRTGLYQGTLAVEEGVEAAEAMHKKMITDAKKTDNDALQWGVVAGRMLALMVSGLKVEEKWIQKISSKSFETTTESTGAMPRKELPKRSSRKGSKKNSTPTS